MGLLCFHLERDADEYAIARTGDRLALASAISKAAEARAAGPSRALALLGGGSAVVERLRVLLGNPSRARGSQLACARLLTVGVGALTLALVALLPTLVASPLSAHALGTAHGCPG